MPLGNKILTVCLGNICRSPAAEGFFVSTFQKKSVLMDVASAGLTALVNQPPAQYSEKVMRESYNIDISHHRAQQITESMARHYDLLLVMDDEQAIILKKMFPFAFGKVHRLGKWRSINIKDPYRQSEEIFQSCIALIHDCVNDWVEKFW